MAVFKYDPAQAKSTIPEGEYDAEIVSVETKTSKAGETMLCPVFKVYGPREAYITEYITPKTLFKLKKLCKVLGLDFGGELDTDTLNGKSVRVKVGIQVDKTGQYEDRNTISGFIEKKAQVSGDLDIKEENIPF